jgi:hypothetical protein
MPHGLTPTWTLVANCLEGPKPRSLKWHFLMQECGRCEFATSVYVRLEPMG